MLLLLIVLNSIRVNKGYVAGFQPQKSEISLFYDFAMLIIELQASALRIKNCFAY